MHVAGRALHRTDATVSAVGSAAGYTSDAAFSNAFKRVMGVCPSGWRALPDVREAADVTDATR
jgi:AraC-like DNA-binding protein